MNMSEAQIITVCGGSGSRFGGSGEEPSTHTRLQRPQVLLKSKNRGNAEHSSKDHFSRRSEADREATTRMFLSTQHLKKRMETQF